ncbi:RpiR family transcriptional regulator, partial [Streptomyces sp. SID11233]|nr:RpiR family transcriptional regulator [Streptomyces sp. SID11233]
MSDRSPHAPQAAEEAGRAADVLVRIRGAVPTLQP